MILSFNSASSSLVFGFGDYVLFQKMRNSNSENEDGWKIPSVAGKSHKLQKIKLMVGK